MQFQMLYNSEIMTTITEILIKLMIEIPSQLLSKDYLYGDLSGTISNI